MARSSDPDRLQPRHRAGPAGALTAWVVGLSVVLTACTGSSSSATGENAAAMTAAADGTAAAGGTAAAAATMAAPAGSADGAGAAGSAGGASVGDGGSATDPARLAAAVAPGDARQIIRTADLAVRLPVAPQGSTEADTAARAAALRTAVADTRAAVVAAGGLVASSDGSDDSTTLGLRIPVDAYDGTLDRLTGLGEVQRRTESSQDVTAELVDVASRIQSMSASVDRVRALLAQATDVGQVVTIEGELARREADLESLQRQQAALAGQVALSTVTLTLTAVTTGTAVTPADDTGNSGFLAGLTGGWSALLGLLTGLGTVAGALLPFLPLVLVAGAVLWWARRRRRRPVGPVVAPSGGSGSTSAG